MSWLPTVTVPVEGVTIPQTMLISVVLPAPLGPSSAKISPFSISRSMRLRAWNPDAYVLVRSEIEMIGVMGAIGALNWDWTVGGLKSGGGRSSQPAHGT